MLGGEVELGVINWSFFFYGLSYFLFFHHSIIFLLFIHTGRLPFSVAGFHTVCKFLF